MKTILFALGIFVLAVSCNAQDKTKPPFVTPEPNNGFSIFNPKNALPSNATPKPSQYSAQLLDQATRFNEVTIKMLKIAALEKDNIFFSPASAIMALGMVYGGAQGELKQEMSTILGYPEELTTAGDRIKELLTALLSSEATTIAISNRLWPESSLTILPQFQDYNRTYFNGTIEPLDYRNAHQQAQQTINSAVQNDTHGKIVNLIPNGALNADTRLVLTNAIYFLGQWQQKFDAALTKKDNFYTTPSSKVSTLFMHGENKYAYWENDQLQSIILPYSDSYALVAILPRENISLPDLINPEVLATINSLSTAQLQKVQVALPKFEFRRSAEITKLLRTLGLAKATAGAPFTAIANTDLAISNIFHQAYIKVDEQGTEAAAATALVLSKTMALSPNAIKVFNANRPFIFMIRHNETGLLLFAGIISNPLQ